MVNTKKSAKPTKKIFSFALTSILIAAAYSSVMRADQLVIDIQKDAIEYKSSQTEASKSMFLKKYSEFMKNSQSAWASPAFALIGGLESKGSDNQAQEKLLEILSEKGLDSIKGKSELLQSVKDKDIAAFPQAYKNFIEQVNQSPDMAGMLAKTPITEAANQFLRNGSGNEPLADSIINQSRMPFQAAYIVLLASLGLLGLLTIISSVYACENREKKMAARSMQLLDELNSENNENLAAIQRLLHDISGVGDGDLTKKAMVGNNITGEIAAVFNRTVEWLKSLMLRVRSISNSISDISEKTVKGINELSLSANEHNRELFRVSETLNAANFQISELIRKVAAINTGIEDVHSYSKSGDEAIQATRESMASIRDINRETAKRLKKMGEESQQAGEITRLMRSLSGSINVLALNATLNLDKKNHQHSLEVLAEEISRLAAESKEALTKTEKMVASLQIESESSAHLMEVTTARIVSGTEMVDRTWSAVASILASAEALENAGSGLSSQMGEVKETSQTASQRVKALTEHSEQTVSAVEEISKTLNYSQKQAKLLQGAIAEINLGGRQNQ